jgi:ABC-type branched-subunit amino acid transport system substrate-binding protein
MSQKNETAILALALLLTVGIVGGGFWWFTNSGVKIGNTIIPGSEAGSNPSLQDWISFGEKTLTPGAVSAAKKEGVEAIAAKSYDQAIANFTDSLKLNRNDPEALIFPTRSGVQQALASSDFSAIGASGTIRFLASGDRNAPVQLVKIVPGSRSRTGYDFEPVR